MREEDAEASGGGWQSPQGESQQKGQGNKVELIFNQRLWAVASRSSYQAAVKSNYRGPHSVVASLATPSYPPKAPTS